MAALKLKRLASITAVLVLTAGVTAAPARNPAAKTIEFRGARWFDGTRFQQRTVYSRDGRFLFQRPSRVDAVVELDGGYALPPFGEAHNHNILGPRTVEAVVGQYVKAGVLYVQITGNMAHLRDAIPAHELNTPQSVDVTFANAVLTGPQGHPISLVEDVLRKGYYAQHVGAVPRGWFEGRSYYIVSNRSDLMRAWSRLIATRPDFIKISLAYSEDHERNVGDPSPAARRGLAPALARDVVRLARKRGLPVIAHTETVGDFRTAIDIGVDQVAHLPGYSIPTSAEEHRFILTEEDAARAARAGMSVVTTISLSDRIREPARLKLVRLRQASNLRILRDAGVRLVVGSDNVDDVGAREFDNLAALGVFTPVELLRMWSEMTPRTIFPRRRIGKIAPGYEASFIVLARNPIDDLQSTDDVLRRFKAGVELQRTTAPSGRPPRTGQR